MKGFLSLGALVLAACGDVASDATESPVARGKYLVASIGCSDCHTPLKMGPSGPVRDPSKFLAGHPESAKLPPPPKVNMPWMMVADATGTAFAGPWGITYATNLTPDRNTGIGIWTEEMFVRALREGKHMGTSRPILPPMPWEMYKNLTEADMRAIYAYLRTIPSVSNRVPDYQPPASKED